MSNNFSEEAKKLMNERFNHDTLISLATVDNNIPHVRTVNGFYEDGAFYVITYAKSNKMNQIENNPNVAISGDWFTAHGKGIKQDMILYFNMTDSHKTYKIHKLLDIFK